MAVPACDAWWKALQQRVDETADGEVFRCIELLSLKEQAQVAQLVRQLLKGQLERARAGGSHGAAVLEKWQRVVGPFDASLMAATIECGVVVLDASCHGASTTVTALGAGGALGSTASASAGADGDAHSVNRKRRRVQLASNEDEDEMLRCAELGDEDTVGALLASAGPDARRLLNATSEGGVTALHHAAFNGYDSLARLLLERAADVDRKTDYGFTPVMAAVQSQSSGMVEMLLARRANVNVATDFDGRTALHLAAGQGAVDLVQALLDKGAIPWERDRGGRTPVDKAQQMGHFDVVRIFELHGGVSAAHLPPPGQTDD